MSLHLMPRRIRRKGPLGCFSRWCIGAQKEHRWRISLFQSFLLVLSSGTERGDAIVIRPPASSLPPLFLLPPHFLLLAITHPISIKSHVFNHSSVALLTRRCVSAESPTCAYSGLNGLYRGVGLWADLVPDLRDLGCWTA